MAGEIPGKDILLPFFFFGKQIVIYILNQIKK